MVFTATATSHGTGTRTATSGAHAAHPPPSDAHNTPFVKAHGQACTVTQCADRTGSTNGLEPALWPSPTPLWQADPSNVVTGRCSGVVTPGTYHGSPPPEEAPEEDTEGEAAVVPGGEHGVTVYAVATSLSDPRPLKGLCGPWRLLLLGDGSPTRHLKLLTGIPVEVDVISMAADDKAIHEAPREISGLSPPLIRRQVWLRCGTTTLAWAESWWNADLAAQHLAQRDRPIWHSLTANRAELYREVDGLAVVSAPHLEARFDCPGPYWSRHYRFFRGGKPLTVIREVFSPRLEDWLGTSCHEGSPAEFLAAS
eukprot:m.171960 g.171960  ORF g.171960 m.171960 type:complete len:311 (-) comp13451_c0_seq1:176-1108(-)